MFNKNRKNSEYPQYLNITENFTKDEIKYLKNLNPEINNLLKISHVSKNSLNNNNNNNINTDSNNGAIKKLISKKKFFLLILEELKKYFNNKKDNSMTKVISLLINEIILISKIVQENIVLTEFFSKIKKEKFNYFDDNKSTKTFDKNLRTKNYLYSKSEKHYNNNYIQNGGNVYKNKKMLVNKNSSFSEMLLMDKGKEMIQDVDNTLTDNGINNKKIKDIINKNNKQLFYSENKPKINQKKNNAINILKNNKSLILNKNKHQTANDYHNNSSFISKISKKGFNKTYINNASIKKNLKYNTKKIEKISKNTKKDIEFSILNFVNSNTEIFKNIETPEFNIFELDTKVGNKNILPLIGYYIFNRFGFQEIINYNQFENWCKKIAEGYIRTNYYHTDLHAADITQTCLNYFKIGKANEICNLTKNSKCSLFLSCMCHDYKHPGVNNNYLKEIRNVLALTYNDASILENMHISETFKIITSNKIYDIFEKLDNDTYKKFRKEMISCVLATDMTFHNNYVNFMKDQIEGKDETKKEIVYQNFMNLLIHSADISNPTKPFNIYFKWAKLVVSEFYDQGDKEKKLGLNCSCDRNKVTIYQSQLGFINFIELKFFESFVKIFPKLSFYYETLNDNKNKLISMEQEEKKKNEEKK